jgi:hypothetical protein
VPLRRIPRVAGLASVAAVAAAAIGTDGYAATSVVASSPSPLHARAYPNGPKALLTELS